ncbi:hypothetical protein HYU45_00775 [Candidatus Daviesbacteria bacterium]|nr:hypothetical protein [Candidatus Daviesbacteria bacterium]
MSISKDFPRNLFATYDIGLSSVLLSLGFALDSLDKTNPQKVQFIFQKNKGLAEAIQAYWAKRLTLEPQTLLANLKLLKNRLYSDE